MAQDRAFHDESQRSSPFPCQSQKTSATQKNSAPPHPTRGNCKSRFTKFTGESTPKVVVVSQIGTTCKAIDFCGCSSKDLGQWGLKIQWMKGQFFLCTIKTRKSLRTKRAQKLTHSFVPIPYDRNKSLQRIYKSLQRIPSLSGDPSSQVVPLPDCLKPQSCLIANP